MYKVHGSPATRRNKLYLVGQFMGSGNSARSAVAAADRVESPHKHTYTLTDTHTCIIQRHVNDAIGGFQCCAFFEKS